MRKEDRIRQQAQDAPQQKPDKPERRPTEEVKGQAGGDRPSGEPHKPGVLPIPD